MSNDPQSTTTPNKRHLAHSLILFNNNNIIIINITYDILLIYKMISKYDING